MNLSNLNVEKLITNIKMACVRHNPPMKMKDLYEKSGVSSSLLSQWNTGKTQPSIAKITAIADALDVPVEQLIGDQMDNGKQDGITVDSFTYAMHGASPDLTERDKKILLDMATQLANANRERRKSVGESAD